MTNPLSNARITQLFLESLTETFENVQGMYLDTGTSLFETLSNISYQEASLPVGSKCATLAAQVDHTRFYIDVLMGHITQTNTERVDWGAIWKNVSAVTQDEWIAINERLRASYQTLRDYVAAQGAWEGEEDIEGVVNILMHTAYHLGEIRQALCFLR